MIKKIFLGLSLLTATASFAQQGTASPYSFYGMGDKNNGITNEYKAMGGVSVYSDSIHLNLNNPASLAKLQLTTLSLGGTFKNYSFKSQETTEKTGRNSIDYIAVGLPLGKFGVSFGLLPYSSVGYKISSQKQWNGQTHETSFDGDGGVNKVFAAVGYEILPNLQLGVDFGYNFGHTDNTAFTFITDNGDDYFIPNGTRQTRRTDYSGFTYDAGVIYSGKIKTYDWHASLTYSPEVKLDVDEKTTLEIVSTSNAIRDREVLSDLSTKITNPARTSLGFGFGKDQKWFVGAEFTHTANRKLNSDILYLKNASFENGQRYAVGGFFIPKYNSFTSYFDRIVYRAGFRYENTGLVVNNQSVNDFAFSLGTGLPIGRNLTNLNISLEYGQRGTTSKQLIKENYFNIAVGISLNDLWFIKRRFE